MPSITLKNIPEKLYARIKDSARRNHRSINSEILFCLESRLDPHRVDPEALINRIEALNRDLDLPPLNDAFLTQARVNGCP